jgi:epidermal growth factor receptor substrate 15
MSGKKDIFHKDRLINLKGESMSTENLEILLKKTRSIKSQKNLDLNGNELLKNYSELDGLLSSMFSINHDLKNVVKSRQSQGEGILNCFKKLRKDIYYLIRNLDIGNYKINKSEKDYTFLKEAKKNSKINQKELNSKMENIKDGIYSIERKGKLKFLENMVNSLKSLENLVGDREAILKKYLELSEVIDGAGEECSTRMEQLKKELNMVSAQFEKGMKVNMKRFKSSSLKEMTNLEIKENYSVLKEVDINRFMRTTRSSMGPGAISKYKKLMDSYANMNGQKKKTKKQEKKGSKKKLNSNKNLTNLRILSNMELAKPKSKTNVNEFSFQIKESSLLASQDSEIKCSLIPEQINELNLQEEIEKLNMKIQEQKTKANKYKKATKEYKIRLKDLETMNANLGNKVSSLEKEKEEIKSEIANLREVNEDLKNECYNLEQQVESKENRIITSCQPKLGKKLECTQVSEYIYLEKNKHDMMNSEGSEIKGEKSNLADRILSMVSLNIDELNAKRNKEVLSNELESLEYFDSKEGTKEKLFVNKNNTNQSFEENEKKVGIINKSKEENKNVFLNSDLGNSSLGCSQISSMNQSEEKKDINEKKCNKWINCFVKQNIKKMSTRKKLEFKKDQVIKQQKILTLKELFKKNKNTITFQALKESLSPNDSSKLGINPNDFKRCSIDFKNASLEKLKKHLNQSNGMSNFITINTSNFKNQEEFLETTKNELIQKYDTLEELLIIPVKSFQKLESFKKLGIENNDYPNEIFINELNKNMEQENMKLKKKIEDLEEELEQIMTENEFYRESWPTEHEMDKMKKESGDKKSEDKKMNEQVNQFQQENVELKDKIFNITKERDQRNEELESVKEEKKKLEEELSNAKIDFDILQEMNNDLEYRTSEYEENIKELEELLTQFELDKEEKEQKRREMECSDMEGFKYFNEQKIQEMLEMKENLEDLESQNIQLIQELTVLEENKEVIENKLECEEKEKMQKEEMINDLEMEKVLLEEGLEKAKIEHEIMIKELRENEEEKIRLQEINEQLKDNQEKEEEMSEMRKKTKDMNLKLKKMMKQKMEIIFSQVNRLESLNMRIGSSTKKISKVEEIMKQKTETVQKTKIRNFELQESLKKVEELREKELKERNKMILVDSEEDMLSQMSRLSNSILNKSRRMDKSTSQDENLEDENKRLASQVVSLEDQLKNLKDKYNTLIFEKNEWEEEKKIVNRLKNKLQKRKEEKEYLKLVKGSNHISLKKENLELKRKLDRVVKLLQKKTDQTESQIWSNFSSIRGSAMPFQMSSLRGAQENFIKNKIPEEHTLNNLNMTIMSNKNSNDSFLNKSGRSDIANNINGINEMIGESTTRPVEESVIMKPKKFIPGHRRTTSDPREFVNGSLILRNFAFKKDEKVSQFAPNYHSPKNFQSNFGVSKSK